MNPFADPTHLPPPSADEVARQLQPPRKRSTLKMLAIPALVLVGISVLSVVSAAGDDDEGKSSTSVSAADIDQTALEIVWGGKSADDRASLCLGYNTAPEVMWDSFNEGAERQMSRATWERFFDAHC